MNLANHGDKCFDRTVATIAEDYPENDLGKKPGFLDLLNAEEFFAEEELFVGHGTLSV